MKRVNISSKGFTLLELMIVVAILAVLASLILVAVKPLQNIQKSSNAKRWMEIQSIANAIKQYQVDHRGTNPSGLDSSWKMIGTDSSGCSIDCGTIADIDYSNPQETLNYYSNNTYTVRHWFDASSSSDFNSLRVAIVLDCDGSCSGTLRLRIGNTSSYSDYDFLSASAIRTDGTTSNYSWYAAEIPASKSTLGNSFFVQLLKYTGSGTVRFLMDESGPAGPDPEFRSDNDGSGGSHTGWTRDNGDYFLKIGVPGKTAEACLDLAASLVDEYFKVMPADPKDGAENKTYYAISQNTDGVVKVAACHAENNEVIQVSW